MSVKPEDALPPAIPFAEAWPLEAALEYHRADASSPGSDSPEFQAWLKAVYHPVMEKLESALRGHVLFLAQEGRLGLPEYAEAVRLPWLTQWRAVLRGEVKEKYDIHDVARPFSKDITMRMFGLKDEAEVAARHARCLDIIEKGDFSWASSESAECRTSGHHFFTEMKGWQPTIGKLVYEEGQFRATFCPLAPCEVVAPGVEHVTIQVPSGELLLGDWFRVAGFTEASERLEKSLPRPHPDINSLQGCVDRTRLYAQHLGFGHVTAGNTSPTVVEQGGKLIVGRPYYDEEYEQDGAWLPSPPLNGVDLGSVCTDLWWVTIIDRQVLVDVASRHAPRAKVEEDVAALLDKPYSSVVKVQVPPGEYHLYFAGHASVFEQFASPDVDVSGLRTPMMVLSPVPLALEPAAPARRPRP